MQLNYFRGLTDCEPKTTTLEEVVRLMTDDMSVRDLTEKYRYYLSMGDENSTRRCKSLLPCFAVAVHFSGGKHNKHIVDFTGLTIVDIDHVPPEEMPRVLTIIREVPPRYYATPPSRDKEYELLPAIRLRHRHHQKKRQGESSTAQ